MLRLSLVFCSLFNDDVVNEFRLRLPEVMIGVRNGVDNKVDSASWYCEPIKTYGLWVALGRME